MVPPCLDVPGSLACRLCQSALWTLHFSVADPVLCIHTRYILVFHLGIIENAFGDAAEHVRTRACYLVMTEVGEKWFKLHNLSRRTRSRKATDPRDKIDFVIAAIALSLVIHRQSVITLRQDYQLSVQQVYWHSAGEIIMREYDLKIPSDSNGSRSSDDLPI
jgi:hypothetical protein